ncbi:MAG: LLM class F420-dependent oxidoreductase [Actinomycetota bacterium]|nr:LLM class F420-dependent oxidoreductase [Actinomycetota bacterium]
MSTFGLQLPSFTFAGVSDDAMFERIARTAVTAEESGFDSFFVMDHYHQIANIGPPTEPMLEAYTVLAGVAARTSKIKLGAMVTGVTYRNPGFLAKVVTTLDIVSAGRAILGIGAAWNEEESRAYGYDWPTVAERFERLEDAIQICRSMFTQRETTFHGRRHHVDGALNVPQPVQAGGPRILVGGGGERKTLRLVAQYADMWNGFGDPDTIRHKLGVLAEHCREVGRDPADIVKTRLGTLIVTPTKEEAERRREAFQAARGIGDRELPSRLIWGDPGTVGDTVQTFLDIGLDGMIFNMPTGSTPDDVALAGTTLSERFGTG